MLRSARCRIAVVLALFAVSQIFTAPPSQAANWTLIYETTSPQRDSSNQMIYTPGYGRNGAAVTAAAGLNWSQVRWRMEIVVGGISHYADASFDKWAGATLQDLEFPDDANNLVVQKNVTNINITSNYSTVKTGSYALGRIEVWPYNYAQARSGLTPAGSATTYDWDDTPSPGTNGHGTFQLHNLTDTQTAISWNRQRYGDTAEIGLGPCVSCTNPDWTLQTGLAVTSFKFQVYVGTAVITPSSIGLSVPSPINFRTTKLITASLGVAGSDGKVTFYQNGKRIPGCINVLSSALVATCSWRPPVRGSVKLTARLTPTSSGYSASDASTLTVTVASRSGNR